MDWKIKAERMKFDEGKSWTEIAAELMPYFSTNDTNKVREKIRTYVRRCDRYKRVKAEDYEMANTEYKRDGSIISEKFITLRDGDDMTPDVILEAHGLKKGEWEVVSCKNNFWNTQVTGGYKQISYQSKLTAKPATNKIDLDKIDKHFAKLDRQHFVIPKYIKRNEGSYMAEVNIADLHLGKLCWRGNTGESYNCKIASELYYRLINEICEDIRHKPLEYITFVWANDFFNADTISDTTTAGTAQDVDVGWHKLYDTGLELLVRGIEMLVKETKTPVKTFYTPSNHDEVNGYHALKYLDAWFRNDKNVNVDTSAMPRKYQLYGNTLIGYCHGNKENSNGSKEKASRLASLMPIEAKRLWSKADYYEMHSAHLHSEQMIQEINGVIVRRISSPTAADEYHTSHAFLGAVRKAQTFLYSKDKGLKQVINTPV